MAIFSKQMNNKFCFITGSFAENDGKLRTPDSDIDVICQNLDKCQVRFLLKHKYPHINLDKVNIDLTTVTTNESNKVKFQACYWQKGKSIELFNKENVKYDISPVVDETSMLSQHIRNPDKEKLEHFLMNERCDIISEQRVYTSIIDRHYGNIPFTNLIYKMIRTKNMTIRTEAKIFKGLYDTNWKVENSCKDFKSFFMNRKDQVIVSTVGSSMTYIEFLDNCIKKTDNFTVY